MFCSNEANLGGLLDGGWSPGRPSPSLGLELSALPPITGEGAGNGS